MAGSVVAGSAAAIVIPESSNLAISHKRITAAAAPDRLHTARGRLWYGRRNN
ncbi:msr9206 (plasmid) [Mesorhizobium japonicum MAFF 303099]|uniref:Msr9206 protein n=1 Tax=Mesorhizobium japonicum (strain LMG 29417 / CECT 9101 / MAFF 303099) TaxID=266835 RepID=Q981W7_RHILO|nr:msr9206 [Mesorhizobium japonicum MAFF 303099]